MIDQIEKPSYHLIVFLIYALALILVSLMVIGLGLRDSLLYLFTIPCLLSAFFYGRRVYLSMLVLLTVVAVWVTFRVSSDFQASSTSIAVVALSSIVMMETIYRLVTSRKQAEESLRQHAAELKASNEELDTFACTVSHDLKNPLSLIIGYAEVIEQEYAVLPEDQVCHYLHTIAQNGLKMSNIIDELLLLSRVRGVEGIEVQPLDMQNIVTEALQRLTILIEENQAEIITPESWPEALGYSPWIEDVWANYVSNAIKYGGQPPRVELGADVRSVTDLSHEIQSYEIHFWVRDNGEGLTPDEQERLFIPFTQLDRVRAKGHGLGLSIVRRIVNKLGGRVSVESEGEQGSIFYFTLPGTKNH